MNINEFQPTSGRFVKKDGTTVNIADELGGKSVSDKVYDIDNMMPHSGRFVKEDGTCANIADMIANGDIGGGGGGGSDSGSSDDSAPPIVEAYNGQTIQCSMSADRPVKGLNLYATCEQKTTTGANLFDESGWVKKTIPGITIEWLEEEGCFLLNGTVTESNSARVSIDIVAEKGATYTLQNYYVSGEISVPVNGFATTYFGASDTEGLSSGWLACHLKEEDREATAQCNYSYITAFWFYVTTGVVLNNYKVRVQLAKSSASLSYEPYTGGIPSPNIDYPQEIQTISDFVVEVKNSMGESGTPQTLNITIPEQGFYGIPVNSGGNYTDSSGQRWVCDEFDFANKKFIKRTGRVSFDGSEDEKWIRNTVAENKTRFYIEISDASTKSGAECWCNRLMHGVSGESGHCFTSNSRFYIDVDVSLNTVELLREYLSTHTLDVIYQLEAPVEYDISDEQIKQFQQLRSYYGTTYIDNDAVPVCNMEAEIILDTKLYIDDKLSS